MKILYKGDGNESQLIKGEIYSGAHSPHNIVLLYSGDLHGENAFINSVGKFKTGTCASGCLITIATEEEKEELIMAMRENNYKWEQDYSYQIY